MIVDGKNLVLGRTASVTAKKLLDGERVTIVNAGTMVITGRKEDIFARYKQRVDRSNLANPRRGPHYPKSPEGIVKRAVRGMLPYRKPRGRDALSRLRVHEKIPKELADKEIVIIEDAKLNKERSFKHITIKELSTHLGG